VNDGGLIVSAVPCQEIVRQVAPWSSERSRSATVIGASLTA
jgi:hypothetical protein